MRKHQMKFMMYADDTQMYTLVKPKNNWLDTASRIEQCLNDVSKWMSANCLKLNHGKTEFIIFKNPKTVKSPDWEIHCGNSSLKPVDLVRNLGVTFDSSLRMEQHVNNVTKSCRYHLRNISRIRRFISKDACRSLVQAAITSRLDYANSLLYGAPQFLIDRLQKVQNAAARTVTCANRRDHVSPLLVQLHWLPIPKRIEYKVIILTYKSIHGCGPSYMKDLINVPERLRPTRNQHQNKLTVPRTKCVRFGDRSFRKAAPTLWNNLPTEMRDDSIPFTVFKKKLKTFLFPPSHL